MICHTLGNKGLTLESLASLSLGFGSKPWKSWQNKPVNCGPSRRRGGRPFGVLLPGGSKEYVLNLWLKAQIDGHLLPFHLWIFNSFSIGSICPAVLTQIALKILDPDAWLAMLFEGVTFASWAVLPQTDLSSGRSFILSYALNWIRLSKTAAHIIAQKKRNVKLAGNTSIKNPIVIPPSHIGSITLSFTVALWLDIRGFFGG